MKLNATTTEVIISVEAIPHKFSTGGKLIYDLQLHMAARKLEIAY
jgi:hypothetical protein